MSGLTLGLCWKQRSLPVRARPCAAQDGQNISHKVFEIQARGTHSLDLVTDQQNIVLLAQSLNALKVVIVGHDDSVQRAAPSQLFALWAPASVVTHPASPWIGSTRNAARSLP